MLEIDSSDCLEKKDLVQKIITSDSSSGPAKKKGGGSVNTRRAKISSLNCIVTENAEDDFDAVVIVCHGFGASENDLAPLAGQLLPAMRSHRVKMVFPQAPVELGHGGYAWWPLDLQKVCHILQHFELFEEEASGASLYLIFNPSWYK